MKSRLWIQKVLLVGLLSGLPLVPVNAGEVSVAVAANFSEPAKQIAALFQKETRHVVTLSFGATGKFYSQIREGAPFDVFLAADVKTPKLLEDEGLAVGGSRYTYALGKLVLWSAKPGFVDDRGDVLGKGGYDKIACADPKLAPYGQPKAIAA